MFKRGIIILTLVLILIISGCNGWIQEQQEEIIEEIIPEQTQQETVIEETTTKEEIEEVPEEPKCSREFSPQFSSGSHYTGPLFDAHFHMPNLIDFSACEGKDHTPPEEFNEHSDPILNNALLDKILCNFDKENVIGVIGFVMGVEEALQETLNAAKTIEEKSPEKINLFLMPTVFSIESLQDIEETNKGLFKGYGEMAFYHPSYAETPPDSTEIGQIYKVAEKNNLIIMMHPSGRQETNVENAVKTNPNVKFLIHGPEPEDYITSLMDKYPNVYYSLDAILIRLDYPGALLYTVKSKEEFKSRFGKNYDQMMSEAINRWKSRIEKHPNKFMWGTDRSDPWTNDEEVSALLEEFARDFISRLDPVVQEKFAYQNAEKLVQ